jgi:hypothetical protein
MVVEQIIDVPADRRVFLDLPRELPAGRVRLELKLTPVNREQHSEEEQAAKSATPITDRLSGILASAGDITLEQIREERLRKYM